MAAIHVASGLIEDAWSDLHVRPEQVGFFLADFDEDAATFRLLEWRLALPDDFEEGGRHHVALTDEAQASAIQWAWSAGRCLVEAHSHGDRWPAEFSVTDLSGFEEWVPHVRWRLRGLPYAAIVTGGEDFDGLAWVDTSGRPEQVAVITGEGYNLVPTGRTLSRQVDDRHGKTR
jgi:hypothetical protein